MDKNKNPKTTESTKKTDKEDKSVTKSAPAEKTAAKQTAKPAAKSASVAATKPASAGKTTTKSAPAEKPVAKATTTEKPTSTTKSSTTEKPAAKKSTAAKSAAEAITPAGKAIAEEKKAPTAKKVNQAEEKKKTENKPVATSEGSFKARAAALVQNKKARIIMISALSFVLILCLVLGLVFGLRGCSTFSDYPWADDFNFYNSTTYKTNTAVGHYSEVVSTVERKKPVKEIRNEGLSAYPVFGTNYRGTEQAALIRESSYLTATGTANAGGGGYTWMDENGYLYSGTRPATAENTTGRQLYQHTASVGLYHGNVADDEPGIIKKVTLRPRTYGSYYSVTGVYAPAGEVIAVKLSGADMERTGGITIHIGQALYNGQANNIWEGKPMPRIPHLLNTMQVNKNTAVYDEDNDEWTAYVGSFIGGPLYIRGESVTFTATISGGVKYSHFILGYTTEKEFEENAKSSAPYFDLEVWDRGVLHSGSKIFVKNFSYEDLYKAAVLWDKVASVTTTGSNQGVVFLYEPFVAAGAAVAFPGRRSVNCPEGWMASSLNYNSIVNSGSWGNFHEYHHNFQGYGVGNGGEVTNNGMTLVSYALFTKISSNRGMSNYGAGSLGGWNAYTCATWALNDLLKIQNGQSPSNGRQGLSIYATLLHNFGADAYIQAKVRQQQMHYGQSYTGYLRAWQDVTHNDMTYFFQDVLGGIDGGTASQYTNSEYSMFVPVSSVYQTGRSYMYDGQKKYFKTMQPYVIPYGNSFTVDLREYQVNAASGQYIEGSIKLPRGFQYKIKNISKPTNGTFTETATPNVYTYTPNGNLRSGEIKVTLEITKDDGAFTVDDVDLVLEFEQSHEMNKTTLIRNTYTYSSDKMYTDAQEAFEKAFAGYDSHIEQDHFNPTQNVNTDIWFRPDTDKYHTQFPNEPDKYFAHDNTIEVLDGKLYFEEKGKYRIYLRGRLNCALYYSTDGGKNYTLGAAIKDVSAPNNSHLFRPKDENTYFDLELEEKSWVYIKEVLIVQNYGGSCSYIGVGMRQWTQTMFTMEEKYYDANKKEVESKESEGYEYTETVYQDMNGNPVAVVVGNKNGSVEYYKIEHNTRIISTLEEVTALTESKLIEPTVTDRSQPYVNAYRPDYEFLMSEFETDYFYVRDYSYNYLDNRLQNTEQTIVSSVYSPATNSGWSGYPFTEDKLVDGNKGTWIHTGGNVSESKPLEFLIDMGSEKVVNRMVIYSQSRADLQVPRAFTLYGSLDGETFFIVHQETETSASATMTFDFEEATFRYYKLVVTKSSGKYIILAEIEMYWRICELNGGNHIAPDSAVFTYEGVWHGAQTASSFGHVNVGEKGAKMTFEFEGTRLGILSSASYGNNFEVFIDGKLVQSSVLKEDDGPTPMVYLCDALAEGKHRVEIRCNDQTAIDSIVVFP